MDYFFYGIQADVKLFLLFPLLCAIFRLIFIKVYQPYPSLEGHWKAVVSASNMAFGGEWTLMHMCFWHRCFWYLFHRYFLIFFASMD